MATESAFKIDQHWLCDDDDVEHVANDEVWVRFRYGNVDVVHVKVKGKVATVLGSSAAPSRGALFGFSEAWYRCRGFIIRNALEQG